MRYPSRPLQAMLLMLFSMALFAAMSSIIRLLSFEMPPGEIVLLRNLMSLPIILLWTSWLQRGLPRFPTERMKSHFWRATVGIISMELWFYSLSIMPLTLATALSFTTPIFSTIFAILFLGEKAGIRRWSAIATGFAGMLIIIRPDVSGISPAAAFVLTASAMMAVAGVLVKTLTRTEPPETIVFYMALFMIPWSVIPAWFEWQPFTPYQLWLCFLIALLSTVAHLSLTRAFMRADMVALMPLDFTRLIFVAIFAYFLFGETLDASTVIGSLVIVASTIYIARREARIKQETTTSPALPG
jgi:drug/metabolite transporter (DMT)-like permease